MTSTQLIQQVSSAWSLTATGPVKGQLFPESIAQGAPMFIESNWMKSEDYFSLLMWKDALL